MNFTKKDFDEISEMAPLLKKIDTIDEAYVNSVSEEIFQFQPFFLTVLLGYRFDVTMEELDEIMKLHFIIWEYFKSRKKVRSKKITQEQFEKIQTRSFQMLNYVAGESNPEDVKQVYASDLQSVDSKALLTAILFRYENNQVLLEMNHKNRAVIFLGMRTFIECFEKL